MSIILVKVLTCCRNLCINVLYQRFTLLIYFLIYVRVLNTSRDGAALIAENEALIRAKGSANRIHKSNIGTFLLLFCPQGLLLITDSWQTRSELCVAIY